MLISYSASGLKIIPQVHDCDNGDLYSRGKLSQKVLSGYVVVGAQRTRFYYNGSSIHTYETPQDKAYGEYTIKDCKELLYELDKLINSPRKENKMTKIVINTCFGSFRLSNLAVNELEHSSVDYNFDYSKRADPQLVEVVERLGDLANGPNTKLKVVEIPNNIKWTIQENDGKEHIAEVHKTWW